MSELLRVVGLTKSFTPTGGGIGRRTIFSNVDFILERGEALGIAGRSGCGKTTLALCVLGLMDYDAGLVFFDGTPMSGQTRRQRQDFRRQAQIVFQDPLGAFDPRMTIGESILEPLRVHERPDEEFADECLLATMDTVGLSAAKRSAHPTELSGGQLQRAAIARSIILAPRLLVLDEPTSSLDGPSQNQILRLLSELQTQREIAFLIISHDSRVVAAMATREIRM